MGTVTIASTFCGPPTSGHGGYSAGLFAEMSGLVDPAVMLRLPPPLDTELDIVHTDEGAELRHGDDLIATAVPADVDVGAPHIVSPADALVGQEHYQWLTDHPFPTCYGCGPDRADGWRTFAGRLGETDTTASTLTVPPHAPADDGTLPLREIWAALDCVTATPLGVVDAPLTPPWVLGRLAVRQLGPVTATDELVATAWPLEHEGRKMRSAGCLIANGEVAGIADATWIQLRAEWTPPR